MNMKHKISGTAVISSKGSVYVMRLVGFAGLVVYRRDLKAGFGAKYALDHAREVVRREAREKAGAAFWAGCRFA